MAADQNLNPIKIILPNETVLVRNSDGQFSAFVLSELYRIHVIANQSEIKDVDYIIDVLITNKNRVDSQKDLVINSKFPEKIHTILRNGNSH